MFKRTNFKIRLTIVLLSIVPLFCDSVARAQPWPGSGDCNDPYQIWTAEDMQAIGADSNYWDAHFVLCADIDLSNLNGVGGNPAFNIIGSDDSAFAGIFDGDAHVISNLEVECNNTDYVALFGYVDANATLRNLRLQDANVSAGNGSAVGALAGYSSGAIINCSASGRVSGRDAVGGLVGVSLRNEVVECTWRGNVSSNGPGFITPSTRDTGGLIGWAWSVLDRCSSEGSVVGESDVGGLVGWLEGTAPQSRIVDCYSRSNVLGTDQGIGGLVGGLSSGCIDRCYSAGSVEGPDDVGGLVGYTIGGLPTVVDSFWDLDTSGQADSDGGVGKITAEMQDVNTFLAAGWDFTTPIWKMCDEPDYPRLWWECPPPVEAEVQIRPKALNLRSKGRWITCYIWLPEDYNVGEIDANSILLEDEVPAERVWLGDGFAVAKFSRREVQEMLGEVETPGEVELVVSGELSDGTIFEGTDTIRVVDKGRRINNLPGKAVKRVVLKRKKTKD